MRFGHDLVAKNDDGSRGEFIDVEALFRLSQRFGHEVMVTVRHGGG